MEGKDQKIRKTLPILVPIGGLIGLVLSIFFQIGYIIATCDVCDYTETPEAGQEEIITTNE